MGTWSASWATSPLTPSLSQTLERYRGDDSDDHDDHDDAQTSYADHDYK